MNCAVAFASEGYGLEAKSIITDLWVWGRDCLLGVGGTGGDLDADKGSAETGTCGSSQPLLATQRRIILHLSPLSRMPLDQVRWPEEEGGRVQQSAATHLLLQSVC